MRMPMTLLLFFQLIISVFAQTIQGGLSHSAAELGDGRSPSAGATATQYILVYEAPTAAPCNLEVSEWPSFSPLIPDIDPEIFPGSNSDVSGSAGTRYWIVGKRTVQQSPHDKKFYSRALRADTKHYFRFTSGGCTVSRSPSGTFSTANIPNGNTFVEPSLWDDVTGLYLFPTMPATRNRDIVDPQTGTAIRRITLAADAPIGAIVRGTDAGFFPLCSDITTEGGMVSPGGGFRCGLQWERGLNAVLYWIHPNGTVRYLGKMYYAGGDQWDSRFIGVGTGLQVDPSYPNYFYDMYTGKAHSAAAGKTVLLRFNQNSDAEVAPNSYWAAYKNGTTILTPGPAHTISDLLEAFDPTYDHSKFPNCHIRALQGDHLVGQCVSKGQDSLGWIFVLNLGDRKPLPHGTMHVEAMNALYKQANSRWCGIHSTMYVVSKGWKWIEMTPKTASTDPSSGGPYQVKLSSGIGPNSTNITVNGEPVSPALEQVQDAAVGDLFEFADNREFAKITVKSGTNWTVQRGCHAARGALACDGTGATAHGAGTGLNAVCEAASVGGLYSSYWWDWANAVHGDDTGVYWVRDTKVANCHRVSREPYDICEGYHVRNQAPWTASTFNTVADYNIVNKVAFAGIASQAPENSYWEHESWNQFVGSAEAKSWFTDQTPFSGAVYNGDSAQKIGNTTYIYRYRLDPNGHPFDPSKLPYFSISGANRLRDISGPAVCTGAPDPHCLRDVAEDNLKYCVVKNAGECVSLSVSHSQPGEVYANLPKLSSLSCRGSDSRISEAPDWCFNHAAFHGHRVTQLGLSAANVLGYDANGKPNYGAGKSRILVSSTMFGPYRRLPNSGTIIAGVPNVLPDGSWILFRCISSLAAAYQDYCMVKVPPQPVDDGVDRTNFVNVSVILPANGTGRVFYGYEENGLRTDFYCAQRREQCAVTGTPGQRINIPAVPGRVVFYQVEGEGSVHAKAIR